MKCNAPTANGQPCRANALKGKSRCFTHDPANSRARALARKKGGERRRTDHGGDATLIPVEVRTIADALTILDYTLAETLPAENSLQRSRVLIALCAEYIKAFEVGELEARLDALEKAVLENGR